MDGVGDSGNPDVEKFANRQFRADIASFIARMAQLRWLTGSLTS
jgi:hypothetical protein